MYHVQYSLYGIFVTVGSFNNYDKALRFIMHNNVIRYTDINLVRIVHKGMVITLNENSLKKAFK